MYMSNESFRTNKMIKKHFNTLAYSDSYNILNKTQKIMYINFTNLKPFLLYKLHLIGQNYFRNAIVQIIY